MPATRTPGRRVADALARDAAAARARVEHAEHLLEGLVTIPGTDRKLGLDVILNIVPGVGPAISTAMGGWIVWEARNLKMSKWQLARMAGNVGIDLALSAIPFVGAIPDFFFRSNSRNLRLIRRHLDRNHPALATIDGEAGPARA